MESFSAKDKYKSFYNKHVSTTIINDLMKKLNYNKDGDFYVKRKYLSLEDYVFNSCLNIEIYRCEYSGNEQYLNTIKKLCDKNYLFEYESDIYFTLRKMKSLNITLDSFLEFKTKLNEYFDINQYIILENIRKEIKCNITEKIISDKAISNILDSIPFRNIKKRDFGRTIIYHKRDLSTKDEFMINLIKNKILSSDNKKQIDIYDLMNLLNNEFNFGFDYYDLVSKLSKLNEYNKIYFSEEMDTVYINKKQYFMEVYENAK